MRLTPLRSFATVVALPILLHAHLLLGFLIPDPAVKFAALGTATAAPLPGQPTIDPNLGYTSQALTAAAARQLLSGSLPWWNSYEGFGVPLAGEMQCSALFLFSLLVALPGGNLALNLLMQIVAGTGMLLLLLRCELSLWPALVGALAYENCGTFSWLSGSWSYSLPWLPFLCLGSEFLRLPGRKNALVGMFVFAVSMYFLITAGFIETSFLEGLVALGWVLVRGFCDRSINIYVYFGRTAVATVLGIGAALPLLIAFSDLLSISLLGLHNGNNSVANHPDLLWRVSALQKFMPYIFGPIFATGQVDVFGAWGLTGGYFGFAACAASVMALFGANMRPLRLLAFALAVLGIGAIIGIAPLESIVIAIPGVKYANYWRFLDPVVEFALAVLAAFAVEDARETASAFPGRIVYAVVVVGLMVALTTWSASAYVFGSAAKSDPMNPAWRIISLGMLSATVAGLISGVFVHARRRATLLGLVVVGEAAVCLFIPTLSYPPASTFSRGGVAYLQEHAHASRVFSLGPLASNYGSYYGIAEINYNDAPVPRVVPDYIRANLDPQADPFIFNGAFPRSGPTQTEELLSHAEAYAQANVGYVVSAPNSIPPNTFLTPVYEDSNIEIHRLKHVWPYFNAAGCSVTFESRNSASAFCSSPGTMCRSELGDPGWSATIDGRRAALAACRGIFQAIKLPRGHSTVRFAYQPVNVKSASLLAFFCICAIAAIGSGAIISKLQSTGKASIAL